MRKLPMLVLITLAVGISSAWAQASSPQSAPQTPSQDAVEQQYPEWFTEPREYRPCPSDVEFPDGRHACLGMGGPSER
jgi:hypothetical protein